MKILWFTNIPMPAVNSHFGEDAMGTGGWMGALLDLLKEQPELEFGVVTACSQYPNATFREGGVEYFIVNQKTSKFRRSLFPVDNDPSYLKRCVEIVDEYRPDIVHIHGTERFYGEMVSKKLVSCPVVISIQGIMGACCEWYRWFGKIPLQQILAANAWDSLKISGLLWDLRLAKIQAKRERIGFQTGKYFFGRTDWDRAYLAYFNDDAKYFKAGEVLRNSFWKHQWQLEQCKKHRIIFTNTRHPRKGTELLLEAIKRLKDFYPDIELVLIGSLGNGSYARWLKKEIEREGGAVRCLGQMTAEEIVEELCKAHLFVSASYIENSPNSVAEAQLVGMPVISSYTGGVPSMVAHGEDGLFFPTGDVPLLVDCVRTIFEDDSFAKQLGANAALTARKRHDPAPIIQAYILAYSIINAENMR